MNKSGYFNLLLDFLNTIKAPDLTAAQVDKFKEYMTLLQSRASIFSLTAIKSEKDIILNHFIDSLTGLILITEDNLKVIDIGTGAGFPGIPLKLLKASWQLTLLEAAGKRVVFLKELCKALELNAVEVLYGRAEDYGRDKSYREAFDLAVCRALSNISTACEYGLPFIRVGGRFLVYKGKQEKVAEEFRRFGSPWELFGAKLVLKHEIVLPLSNANRTLILFQKNAPTSAKYPRRKGLPGKRPLKYFSPPYK